MRRSDDFHLNRRAQILFDKQYSVSHEAVQARLLSTPVSSSHLLLLLCRFVHLSLDVGLRDTLSGICAAKVKQLSRVHLSRCLASGVAARLDFGEDIVDGALGFLLFG